MVVESQEGFVRRSKLGCVDPCSLYRRTRAVTRFGRAALFVADPSRSPMNVQVTTGNSGLMDDVVDDFNSLVALFLTKLVRMNTE